MQDIIPQNDPLQNIPKIDPEEIKIKKQNYKDFSEQEKLKKEKEDWDKYVSTMIGIFMKIKLGKEPENENDFVIFMEEFISKYKTILDGVNPDYEYFRSLSPKVALFIEDAKKIEVPETLLDVHVGFLEILQGYLLLSDPSIPKIEDDLLVQLSVYSKMRNLNNVLLKFLDVNFVQYNARFDEIK